MSSFLTSGLASFCLLALPLAGHAAEWDLRGPLIAHDPTLVREGDTWWCFYTGAGLPCKSSQDGMTWIQRDNFFSKELSWWREYAPNMGKIDIWAPDIRHFSGRYWLYYSVSEFGKNNSAIGLVSCTSIAAGDWRDEGRVLSSHNGQQAFNAIDPNLVIDAQGKPWLAFGSWFIGICLVELDPATMRPSGPVHTIAHRENGIEGPYLVYREGWYYLFASIDKCCSGVDSTYKTVYGRSRDILGPYVDKSGKDLLQGGGSLLEASEGRYIGPGGGSIVQEGNSWINVRHIYDAQASGKPMLRIGDLFFDTEGWPTK